MANSSPTLTPSSSPSKATSTDILNATSGKIGNQGTSMVEAIRWKGDHLELLDQRLLPHQSEWVVCSSAKQAADAIHQMIVRGAPAIGIVAAYGLVMAAQRGDDFAAAEQVLAASRPTAVNLRWALDRMRGRWSIESTPVALLDEALAIHAEDIAQNRRMAGIGASLLPEGARVLTHCNTGALATGGHGTALGVIRTAWAMGKLSAVYHTETRPWLQGARLTAYELAQEGIPARMIADGAGAQLMSTEGVDWVIVGADRIAANGDTANKIGTYALALAARALGAKFMVVAPSGTFDLQCPNGAAIPIEQRGDEELTRFGAQLVAPVGTRAYNPVFDVTPAALIDALVCEHGFVRSPTELSVRALLQANN
jgi:methylthioribose-1-phosphate isomerase